MRGCDAGIFVCRTLTRPLTLLLDIHPGIHLVGLCSFILTKDKRRVRRTHKIKSSDAEQHSVLTSLTASLGKSHAVALVSITSPQLQRCSHTHTHTYTIMSQNLHHLLLLVHFTDCVGALLAVTHLQYFIHYAPIQTS